MSYCVNCGVELDASAKKCALCGTPVINPNEDNKETQTPFSEKEYVIPKTANRRFIAYIISVVFLIPNIVCFLTNAIFMHGSFWSIYVNATSFLVWVVFVFPFITKKIRPYLMWLFDSIASGLYVYFFFAMGYERQIAGWFYTCALPIIITISLLVIFFIIWVRRKKRHWVLKSIGIISEVAVFSLVCGSVIDYTTPFNYAFDIGLIVFVSCAVLTAFLIYCYTSKHMRNYLAKKFFI
ncbi:MAG: hypothetical protein ACI4GY_05735 [Acutalibacteraceae bacterium]